MWIPHLRVITRLSLEVSRYDCAEAAFKCLGSVACTSGHSKHVRMSLIMNAVSGFAPFMDVNLE